MVKVNVINAVSFRSVTSSQGSWTIICGRRAFGRSLSILRIWKNCWDSIRRWIISLVSLPTHCCIFLLFVFVFVYRRRIYWGTMLLRIRRHEILLKMAGSRHLPWSLNWKSWGITWQIHSRPGARVAPVMSDWVVILEQFKGWWRYVGVCFLVGGVVNRAIRNLKFTEEITGSTFLFLQRTIRFSFHVSTGVYTIDIYRYWCVCLDLLTIIMRSFSHKLRLLLFWFWSHRRGGNFPGAIFSAMAPDNAALPRCSAWHDLGSGR